jgi:hypothetical protein
VDGRLDDVKALIEKQGRVPSTLQTGDLGFTPVI